MYEAPRFLHDDLGAEFSLTWNFSRLDYLSPAEIFSRHDQQSINVISRWNWYTTDFLTLRSGLDYTFTNLDSTEIDKRNRHDGGIYLTIEYKPVDSFLITPSAKTVFTNNEAAVIPKLGLLWNVTEFIAIKNNYFRNFKFPDFEELYWSGGSGAGNPNLKSEDGWGTDFGIVWNVNQKIVLDSAFYVQWLKDSIHWYSGSSGIWQPENVGEAVFFGLDTKLGFEIKVSSQAVKKLTLSLTYRYLRSYLLGFGYSYDSNKRIPYNPEHTIGGLLDISWETGSFYLSGHYEGLRYHDRSNLIILDPYFLLNAGLNQKITKNISAFGSIQNILNKSYESFYSYPMPGINLTLGLRANLEIQ